MTPINTRIAPSPTGYFHLGTARTAYFNYLVAKATGGQFILRIDDTDVDRNNSAYYDCIFDTFNWLDLKYDQLHYQSKRLDFYHSIADKLIAAGHASRLDDGAVKLKYPDQMPNMWTDSIAGTMTISQNARNIADGQIIMKSDGTPTYNFASILDDVDLGVTQIIRGVDHIINTPRQIAVLVALDGILPVSNFIFTHIGLIHHRVGDKIVKMSKRDGAMGVIDYKNQNYAPDALLNYIMRMGWGHPDHLFDKKHKIIDRSQAIDFILQGQFRSAPSTHDIKKLDNLNNIWQKKLSRELLA